MTAARTGEGLVKAFVEVSVWKEDSIYSLSLTKAYGYVQI